MTDERGRAPVGAWIRFPRGVVEVNRGRLVVADGDLSPDFMDLLNEVGPHGWVDWLGVHPDLAIAQRILDAYPFGELVKYAGGPVKAGQFAEEKHKRYPKGHPLGGQWMPMAGESDASAETQGKPKQLSELEKVKVSNAIFGKVEKKLLRKQYGFPEDDAEFRNLTAVVFENQLQRHKNISPEDMRTLIRDKAYFPRDATDETFDLNGEKIWNFVDHDLATEFDTFFAQHKAEATRLNDEVMKAQRVTLDLGHKWMESADASPELEAAFNQATAAEKTLREQQMTHSESMRTGINEIMRKSRVQPKGTAEFNAKLDVPVLLSNSQIMQGSVNQMRTDVATVMGDLKGTIDGTLVDDVSEVTFHALPGNYRAYASGGEVTLYPLVNDPTTIYHEMGHVFENNNQDVQDYADAFRRYRSAGEPPRLLREITGNDSYGDEEFAQADRWLNPYAGKLYAGNNVQQAIHPNNWYDPSVPTEVLSMGVENLYTDPMYFWQRDPEHFLFTVTALSGRTHKLDQTALADSYFNEPQDFENAYVND